MRLALNVLVLMALASWTMDAWAESAELPGPKAYEPRKMAEPIPGQPYDGYSTLDRFGREITFYLTKARTGDKPLPLIAYIEGSGCVSRFVEHNGRVVPTGGHVVVPEAAGGSAHVLIVEKPGVSYLDNPRDGCKGMADFNREHTLDRWAEAVEAAIRAARALPQIDRRTSLVIGHSEGGLVACRIARDLPEIVTHVASLSGGGPSQLFDLISLARTGAFFGDVSDDPEERVLYVIDTWKEIQSDPTSTEKFFFGFTYRRWSTFLSSSPLDELAQSGAKIYIAQGAEDQAVDPASSEALYAQLLAHGRNVVYDRVKGANHSFRIKDAPGVDGWRELLDRIVNWFTAQ